MPSQLPTSMRAVGLNVHMPIDDPTSFQDIQVPVPILSEHDLLVKVHAISINPVDAMVRAGFYPLPGVNPRILGWDVAGTVVAVGPNVSLFQVGDAVYYAGSVIRQGGNSEFHAVDERIVGRKPSSLDFAEAAALPLTSITAWECLFDRLAIPQSKQATAGQSLLVLNGAGGVGSIAIQLAKQLTGLTVVATASRPESIAWVRELGADHVVNHREDIVAQLKQIGVPQVDYVLVGTAIEPYFASIVEIIKPQGKITSIVRPTKQLPFENFMVKSVAFVWQSMFTRSRFQTPDMIQQHELLNRVADLVDNKTLRTTIVASDTKHGVINAANLKQAHQALEAGQVVGKLVLEGF
ncbi:Aste57867_23987 [Aphanomyces stellatus]|uniref:Aste57867_23987 protein n=1 Tax=Aphanomyces stellatus TaxID=120398 RepID=A0A485LP76_9STRA|nr:hypothetical protein As57867_023914 [Aphanomyces stellatus]VFU00630.1 Aste57867_23987 [Aphanomyces stellatus]